MLTIPFRTTTDTTDTDYLSALGACPFLPSNQPGGRESALEISSLIVRFYI